jgi:hypothetical protein
MNEILKKSKIERIHLTGNNFTHKGFEDLKESLVESKYLKEIYLGKNKIS